eukprot:gene86-3479_t
MSPDKSARCSPELVPLHIDMQPASPIDRYNMHLWVSQVRLDDLAVSHVLRDLEQPVSIHECCKTQEQVRRAIGYKAERSLAAQLRPLFSKSRPRLLATVIASWQKRLSHENLQCLYEDTVTFRLMRGGHFGYNLDQLAFEYNIGTTALGMALVGGLFSKYFCTKAHHLDPSAGDADKFRVISDEHYLQLIENNEDRKQEIITLLQSLIDVKRAYPRSDFDDIAVVHSDQQNAGVGARCKQQQDEYHRKYLSEFHKQENPNMLLESSATATLKDNDMDLGDHEQIWKDILASDELCKAALQGALIVDGIRYYSETDKRNRMIWFEQTRRHSSQDKVSAFSYRDAQIKPAHASQAEKQLICDLEAIGVPKSSYMVQEEMKKQTETNLATPDVKFKQTVCINGVPANWVHTGSGLILPHASSYKLLRDLTKKLRKYVEMYGCGILLLYHVPVSAHMEQWAIDNLGEECARKISFQMRIQDKDHTRGPFNHWRSSSQEIHKRVDCKGTVPCTSDFRKRNGRNDSCTSTSSLRFSGLGKFSRHDLTTSKETQHMIRVRYFDKNPVDQNDRSCVQTRLRERTPVRSCDLPAPETDTVLSVDT